MGSLSLRTRLLVPSLGVGSSVRLGAEGARRAGSRGHSVPTLGMKFGDLVRCSRLLDCEPREQVAWVD